MDTERILEDAELAAIFFRALVAKGIETYHAASMTSSYLSSRLIARMHTDKPKEPWEGE
jgi:hypothetical protein